MSQSNSSVYPNFIVVQDMIRAGHMMELGLASKLSRSITYLPLK